MSENKPDWEVELSAQITDEWTKGKTYVSDLNELYDTLYDMLRGERPEKDYDWESNIVINKMFQMVWTAVPYVLQKIFGGSPIVGVTSYDAKGAWQREEILEFWHTFQGGPNSSHVPYYLVILMMTLRGLLNGVSFMKKTWHQKLKTKSQEIQEVVPFELDAEGNEIRTEPHTRTVRFTLPVEDWPENQVINNKDIVTDWLLQPGQNVRQGRFVIHRSMLDLDALHKSKINYMNLDLINPGLSSVGSELNQDHAQGKDKDGQGTPPESDTYTDVEVYERVGLQPVYKAKKNGQRIPCFDKDEMYTDKVEFKHMVATIVKQGGSGEENDIVIYFDKNNYEEINYIDMHIFLDPEKWESTGMAEPIKDTCVAINDTINAAFDEMWQNMFPPVIVDKYRLWDWDTMQHAPGQKWLVGGDPNSAIKFKDAASISRDVWQKYSLLDNEIQLMSQANAMRGMAKEKGVTTNVMNAQMSAAKLDHIIKMIEVTTLVPSAQMDVRFAKKFAHKLTLQTILKQPFRYSDWEEIYNYVPVASSVKLEQQKETEIQQDIMLIQMLQNIQNPKMPKIVNYFLGNILRNRNAPQMADMLDEDFYEPSSPSGNMQMLGKMMGNKPSNQQGLPMSQQEKGVRQLAVDRGMNK